MTLTMICEFDYCIYNRQSVCVLDQIQINRLGMCEEAEMISVPGEDLEEYKRRRLKEIEKIWADFDKRTNEI